MRSEEEVNLKLKVYEEILDNPERIILSDESRKHFQEQINILKWVLDVKTTEDEPKTLISEGLFDTRQIITTKDKVKTNERQPGKRGRKKLIVDYNTIINFIKTKDHSIHDIMDEFKLSKAAAYLYCKRAGVDVSRLPKRKKEKPVIKLVPKKTVEAEVVADDNGDWDDADEYTEA
jgi:hypothetical protein